MQIMSHCLGNTPLFPPFAPCRGRVQPKTLRSLPGEKKFGRMLTARAANTCLMPRFTEDPFRGLKRGYRGGGRLERPSGRGDAGTAASTGRAYAGPDHPGPSGRSVRPVLHRDVGALLLLWGRGSAAWLLGTTFILTLGELYLSPIGLSFVTKMAPARMVSMMMGIWFLSSFFGNYLSGYLGTYWGRMSPGALLCRADGSGPRRRGP